MLNIIKWTVYNNPKSNHPLTEDEYEHIKHITGVLLMIDAGDESENIELCDAYVCVPLMIVDANKEIFHESPLNAIIDSDKLDKLIKGN